jgi:hypothetical protein
MVDCFSNVTEASALVSQYSMSAEEAVVPVEDDFFEQLHAGLPVPVKG